MSIIGSLIDAIWTLQLSGALVITCVVVLLSLARRARPADLSPFGSGRLSTLKIRKTESTQSPSRQSQPWEARKFSMEPLLQPYAARMDYHVQMQCYQPRRMRAVSLYHQRRLSTPLSLLKAETGQSKSQDSMKMKRIEAIVRAFELTELAVGRSKNKPNLPRAVDDLGEDILDRDAYEEALKMRRHEARDLGRSAGPAAAEQMRERVELAHAFLSGYISHERHKRSQAVVSAVLSAAVESYSSLDETMRDLRERGALDRDLIEYVDSLVAAEALKCGATPTEPLSGWDNGNHSQEKTSEDDLRFPPSGGRKKSALLRVLEIVRDRIAVERSASSTVGAALKVASQDPVAASTTKSTKGLTNLEQVRLLALLTSVESDSERGELLRKSMSTLQDEDALQFCLFCESGATYLTDKAEREILSAASKDGIDGVEARSITDGDAQLNLDLDEAAQVRQAGRVQAVARQVREYVDEKKHAK